jgi:hypothetical protein
VGGDRSGGEEEAGRDLFVRVACGSEQGDLALLRREGRKSGLGLGDGDAGGSQFTVRAVRPGGCPQPLKDLGGARELAASVGSSFAAAQVGTVGELDAGQVERPALVAGSRDCLFEGGGAGFWFGDGRAGKDDQAQARREPLETAFAGSGDVSSGLFSAAGMDSGQGTLGRRRRPSITPNDVVRRNREVSPACGLYHVGHMSVLTPLEHLVLVEGAKSGLDHCETPGQRMVCRGATPNSP